MLELPKNIKIVIAIGNPGKKYSHTRHNAGHIVLNTLENYLNSLSIKSFHSEDFMNNSGTYVYNKLNFYKFETSELLILHDDLDIKLGEYKLDFAKGPKVHNGINDIEKVLKTNAFYRLRIGIDNREVKIQGADYVLDRFTTDELSIIKTLFV